jgi:hypothetical protein
VRRRARVWDVTQLDHCTQTQLEPRQSEAVHELFATVEPRSSSCSRASTRLGGLLVGAFADSSVETLDATALALALIDLSFAGHSPGGDDFRFCDNRPLYAVRIYARERGCVNVESGD